MRALLVIALLPGLAVGQVYTENTGPPPEPGEDHCTRKIYRKTFPSLDIAAAEALGRLFLEQVEAEHAGYILERDGQYQVAAAVTQGDLNSVTQKCLVLLDGSRLAAVYHTHAAHPVFSKWDRRNAARLGVPSYMATMRDGMLFRYDPETRETVDIGTIEAEGQRVRVTWNDGDN